ncbi:putative monooxygenase [Escovopsis weberi]|uniref:Putative monooxygenase n=1 Tax=Escovopsis weberi TaxID=150374 RepID=A0A0M8MZ29_ESCWE|nr:putative monooxygenase [Escovopsis weberi]
MSQQSKVANPILNPFLFLYQVVQCVVAKALAPSPPRAGDTPLSRPRIAVIGAGITGVSAAAHIVGHGFDVTIFEAGGEDRLGGIWSRVNDTSGLQIHSVMYRFHPSVMWEQGYPDRNQIIGQVEQLWRWYGLPEKTRFDTRVDKVRNDDGAGWVVNDDPRYGRFDGLIVAVGTCGEPKMPHLAGMEEFGGPVYHSSQLTGKDVKDKNVVIIGGGASAVEGLEYAAAGGAAHVTVVARSEKWIIPRNVLVDALLALNIFGQETLLSTVPELALRKLFYRDLEDLAPAAGGGGGGGLFTGTPMVSSGVMAALRGGAARWVRGDVEALARGGVVVHRRARGVPKHGPGHRELVPADAVVMATGFRRPSLALLPDDCFADRRYGPPNWYLQTFPPGHPSATAINATYVDAIGSVGNWHVGIYTRILLMFVLDPLSRPGAKWMRRWVDMTRALKALAPTGALDFFTYLELVWWFVFCVAFNPFRWKWALFVFLGVGLRFPRAVVAHERRFLGRRAYERVDEGTSF